MGKKGHENLPADLVEVSRKATRDAIKTGAIAHEALCRRKDSSVIYADIMAQAIRDEDGELKCVAVVHKDVTQRRVVSHRRTLATPYGCLLDGQQYRPNRIGE